MTKFENILQDLKDKQQNKTLLYEQIFPPGQIVYKSDLELQPNPAYGIVQVIKYPWIPIQLVAT